VFEMARFGAAKIFAKIGIRVQWKVGLPRQGTQGACGPAEVPVIGVKVCSKAIESSPPGAVALAQPYSDSATRVYIFYDRIQSTWRAQPDAIPPVLAHVLVHEITHVLQGVDRHSRTGVMKGAWGQDDFSAMRKGPIPFAPTDVELIYDGIARMKRQPWCPLPANAKISATLESQ
jgi:hypothetical protein